MSEIIDAQLLKSDKGETFYSVITIDPIVVPVVLSSTKVLELGDAFLEVKHDGIWFMKFYAPWCAHCKKLEPVWSQVAQFLGPQGFRVGRVDCTRFPSVCSEMKIRGYPQILLLKGDEVIAYNGDRNREGLIDFALRAAGPAVRQLKDPLDFKEALRTYEDTTFFVYVGETKGLLWESYTKVAKEYLPYNYFFATSPTCAEQKLKLKDLPAVVVFKDGKQYIYEGSNQITAEARTSQVTPNEPLDVPQSHLKRWVGQERFSRYVKITGGNFSQVARTGKLLVLAVLEENKIGKLTPSMKAFQRMVEYAARANPEKYHGKFLFGWVPSADLVNTIAMERLEPPTLLVIDPENEVNYSSDDLPEKLTEEAILIFLDSVLDGSAPARGGSGFLTRIQRIYFQARTSVEDMWKGNPVLTAVLFGLPFGFLLLICYSIFCSDVMDAAEDEGLTRMKHKNG